MRDDCHNVVFSDGWNLIDDAGYGCFWPVNHRGHGCGGKNSCKGKGGCSVPVKADHVKDKAGIGCDAKGESKGVSGIREHMEVYASCGTKVGVVDHLEGNTVKLTKSDSPDGQHHFIPTSWVGRVHENHVHLTKNSVEAKTNWKNDAASCASIMA
jgi:hypothetical protein